MRLFQLLPNGEEFIPPPAFISLVTINLIIILLAFSDEREQTLIHRLFPEFRGLRNQGRDVWSILEQNPHIFWYATGKTPVTLSVMVQRIGFDVGAPRHLPRAPVSDRRRRCLLDERNRVLLVMMWLSQYIKQHVLAHIFNISKSTVAEEIHHIVPIIFVIYQHYISWHSLRKWHEFLDRHPHYPNVVGMIEGTMHRIRRPSEPR